MDDKRYANLAIILALIAIILAPLSFASIKDRVPPLLEPE